MNGAEGEGGKGDERKLKFRVQFENSKGRYVVCDSPIKAGDLVMSALPSSIVPTHEFKHRICARSFLIHYQTYKGKGVPTRTESDERFEDSEAYFRLVEEEIGRNAPNPSPGQNFEIRVQNSARQVPSLLPCPKCKAAYFANAEELDFAKKDDCKFESKKNWKTGKNKQKFNFTRNQAHSQFECDCLKSLYEIAQKETSDLEMNQLTDARMLLRILINRARELCEQRLESDQGLAGLDENGAAKDPRHLQTKPKFRDVMNLVSNLGSWENDFLLAKRNVAQILVGVIKANLRNREERKLRLRAKAAQKHQKNKEQRQADQINDQEAYLEFILKGIGPDEIVELMCKFDCNGFGMWDGDGKLICIVRKAMPVDFKNANNNNNNNNNNNR